MTEQLRSLSRMATVLAVLAAWLTGGPARAENWIEGEDYQVEGVFESDPTSEHLLVNLGGDKLRVDVSAFTLGHRFVCDALLGSRAAAYGVIKGDALVVAPDFFTRERAEAQGFVELTAGAQSLRAYAAHRRTDVVRGVLSLAEPEVALAPIYMSGVHAPDFAALAAGIERFEHGRVRGVSRRAYVALGELFSGAGEFYVDGFGLAVTDPEDPAREVFEAQVSGEVFQNPTGERVLVTRTGARLRLTGPALDELPDHHDYTLFGTLVIDRAGHRGELIVYAARGV